MNKTTVITWAGGIAMMLAFGISVAKTAGPCMVGQDQDKTPAASPEATQNRFNWFGDGWNIEHGMMGPGELNGRGPGMTAIYPWVIPPYRQFDNPIDKKDAHALVQNYIDFDLRSQNTDMKLCSKPTQESDGNRFRRI
jgi:hypothetical protein